MKIKERKEKILRLKIYTSLVGGEYVGDWTDNDYTISDIFWSNVSKKDFWFKPIEELKREFIELYRSFNGSYTFMNWKTFEDEPIPDIDDPRISLHIELGCSVNRLFHNHPYLKAIRRFVFIEKLKSRLRSISSFILKRKEVKTNVSTVNRNGLQKED